MTTVTTLLFLAGWTIRSSIMILAGAIVVSFPGIRNATMRWAVWTLILGGSLLIPVTSTTLPSLNIGLPKALERPVPRVNAPGKPVTVDFPVAPAIEVRKTHREAATVQPSAPVAKPFDWGQAVLAAYVLISAFLLSRVCLGLGISLVLLRRSLTTDIAGIRESDSIRAPVTLGIVRPSIVLPADWRDWSSLRLAAVLAHERSHIARWDPVVQLLSAIHRALLWVNPLSWFLHQRIVRAAEESSDDAAVEATQDRTAYAESLLDFMKRGVWSSSLAGIPMARYGNPEFRIRRILDGALPSRGMTKKSVAAIVALGSPLVYVVATAQPQNPPKAPAPITQASPAPPVPASNGSRTGPTPIEGAEIRDRGHACQRPEYDSRDAQHTLSWAIRDTQCHFGGSDPHGMECQCRKRCRRTGMDR